MDKVYYKEYYQENKEKISRRNKEWQKEHPNYSNDWIRKHPGYREKRYEKYKEQEIERKREYRKEHPELRFGRLNPTKEDYEKWLVNNAVYLMVKSGKLKKEPCKVCENVKVHAHHEDYSKPLVVIWLCAKHHKVIHKGRPAIINQLSRIKLWDK